MSKKRVYGAPDDPFEDMQFDDEIDEDLDAPQDSEDVDPENISDAIDDMSNTLDDMNEALQGFDEDDIDIELENNIENHMIAECEHCHGVFISSVLQTEALVEKITGECPLCGNSCDQYLKWVIKSV